jgi:hypothetical protein
MRYDIWNILKNNELAFLMKEFAIDSLLNYFGKPLEIKKIKKLKVYKYDYLEIASLNDQLHSIMFDDLNCKYETDNAVIYEIVEPLLEVKLPLFKTMLDENNIGWNLSIENTFNDQVCLKIKSGWLFYFNNIDEIIRSAIYLAISGANESEVPSNKAKN